MSSSSSSSSSRSRYDMQSYRQSTPWAYPVEIDPMIESTPKQNGIEIGLVSPLVEVMDDRSETIMVDGDDDGRMSWVSNDPRLARRSGSGGEYSYHRQVSSLGSHNQEEEGMPDSPIVVSPARASDYAKMSMSSATPPPSDVGITTYMSRAVKMVKKIHKMPWMVGTSERVTVDYYPGKMDEKEMSEREEDLYESRMKGHVTSVSWKSREYIEWRRNNYGHVAASGEEEETEEGSSVVDSAAAVIEPFPFSEQ